MEVTANKVKDLAERHFESVRGFRRHLHAHPELSFEEYHTAKFIAEFLRSNDIEFTGGMGGGTGIVCEMGKGDRLLALRADMDALPIRETNEVPYKSQNDGVMHACGHDVHTASLMGVLLIVKDLQDALDHRIRFVFQPGEERLPGGASLMIGDGVLNGVDSILGQHVHPSLPAGSFGVCKGYFMASADEIFIEVHGKGGHAARPQEVVDPVLASAAIIQALQSLVSRRADPMTPSVLSIGKIQSDGGATNIIPDTVRMEGTFRTFDETWRKQAHLQIRQTVEETGKAFGVKAEAKVNVGYPALFNHHELTGKIASRMTSYAGEDQIVQLPPRMTAEDFAYYSHLVPACFYRLGTGKAGEESPAAVHTSDFDVDEDALKHGIGMMAWLALAGPIAPDS